MSKFANLVAGIVGVALAGLAVRPAAAAGLLDIQFTSASGPVATGPAAIGASGDLWNTLNTATGTSVALTGSTGAATPVTLTWSSPNIYHRTNSTNTVNAALADGYLYSSTSISLNFGGLIPGAIYNLYVYNGTDPNPNPPNRPADVTANGIELLASGTGGYGRPTTFVSPADYIEFAGLVADGTGAIAIAETLDPSNSNHEIDLNGIQLQFVSAPAAAPVLSTWAMAGLAGLLIASAGILLSRLRRA